MSNRKSLSKKQDNSISLLNAPVKLLGQEFIRIYKSIDEPSYSRFLVPPSTPKEVYFDNIISPLPDSFPKLKNIPLPSVRMIGVKATIETLAQYFKCHEFKLNLLQFWFLDMLTDCLWRAQDDYQFPEAQQKIILEWVLFFFKLIIATNMNLSRKKVLRIFNEAMYLAENLVEAGAESIPLPEHLFTINTVALDEGGGDCDSLASEDFLKDQEEYVVITSNKETEVYRLPNRTGYLYTEDECLSSSVESLSEASKKESIHELDNDVPTDTPSSEEFRDFYKPDMSTPPRFKSSESISDESRFSESVTETEQQNSEETVENPVWKLVPRVPKGPCPSRVFQTDAEFGKRQPTEAELEEKALQAWYEYHLWQLRKDEMDNEKLSAAEFPEEISQIDNTSEQEQVRKDFVQELKAKSVERKKIEEDIFINSCVLMAIKEFFVDYFYESLQFDIIRLAYKAPHYLLTQELNKEWKIPKLFKGELKRPLAKKKKKVKQAKEKKIEDKKKKGKKIDDTGDELSPKKSTKASKGTKSIKSSAKTDDTDKADKKKKKGKGKKEKEAGKDKRDGKEKADVKDKRAKKDDKDKKDKKDKKSKKGENSESEADGKDKKKRNKSKGEKEKQKDVAIVTEILTKGPQKFKADQEQQAEEKRKEEENKKFIFPLTKAVDNHFFQSIFEDWTPPPAKGKKSASPQQQNNESDLQVDKTKNKEASEKSSGKKGKSREKTKKK